MILSTDNYEEIYRQMKREKEKVDYYLHKEKDKVFKKFNKDAKAPDVYYKTITMQESKNKYLLYYYAMTYNEVRNNACFFGSLLMLNDNDGNLLTVGLRRIHVTDENFKNCTNRLHSLYMFTGHFYSRYRERFLKTDVPTLELVATFSGRNMGYFNKLDYENMILDKNKQKDGAIYGLDDGLSIANEKVLDIDNCPVLVLKNKTFLSRDILKENQEKLSPSQAEMRAQLLNHNYY